MRRCDAVRRSQTKFSQGTLLGNTLLQPVALQRNVAERRIYERNIQKIKIKRNNSNITSFLNATLCDVATQCDDLRQSSLRGRFMEILCTLLQPDASQRRRASHL